MFFFLIPNIKIASLKIQKPSGNELLAIFEMVILGADFSAENLHHQSAPNRFRLPRRSSPEKIASEAMAKLREAKLRIWKSRGSHVQNHHTLGMMIQIMMKSWEPWIHDEEVAPLPPPVPPQNKRKHLSVFNGLLPLGVLALVTTWPSMYRFMKYLNKERGKDIPTRGKLENHRLQTADWKGICDRSQEGRKNNQLEPT